MKNKTLLLFLAALLLGITAIYIVQRNDSGSIRAELMDFAIKDTATISRIFLADRAGNSTLLSKRDGKWFVSDSIPPRSDMMKNLLRALYSVSVKSRISESGFNTVIKALSSEGIKCEIYRNDEEKPFKTYYIGGHTEDALGTYMMLENSSTPFVTEIPGFNGYLTPWYNPVRENWIEPILFRYVPEQIAMLGIEYSAFPERSFLLERKENKFILKIPFHQQTYSVIDSVAVENYLALYSNVYYDSRDKRMSRASRDSLRATTPLSRLMVKDLKGETKTVSIYPMPINESSIILQDTLGMPLTYDVDRMYGFILEKDDWVVLQHFSFDKLFRKGEDFLPVLKDEGR